MKPTLNIVGGDKIDNATTKRSLPSLYFSRSHLPSRMIITKESTPSKSPIVGDNTITDQSTTTQASSSQASSSQASSSQASSSQASSSQASSSQASISQASSSHEYGKTNKMPIGSHKRKSSSFDEDFASFEDE